MSEGGAYLGIDFGTTNSAMASYDPEKGEARVLRNAEGYEKTPSLVFYGENEGEVHVGGFVENLLKDSERFDEEERRSVARRAKGEVKRSLVDPPPWVPLPGKKRVPKVEVVKEILKKLKRDAEERHFNREVGRAVITCPAAFGTEERKALREAAALAGFGEVELFEEPVAAALAFSRRGMKVGEGVLVYDLGGGTFDLALVSRGEDGSLERMEEDGEPRLGGADFDRAIYEHYRRAAGEAPGPPAGADGGGEVDPALLSECRAKKEWLSEHNVESVVVRHLLGGRPFPVELSRREFEGMIAGEVEKTVRKTASLVERARRRGQEVETVVLVGGSSEVPLVGRRLKEELGLEPRRYGERDYAVASGAAHRAFELWGPKLPPEGEYREAVEKALADGRSIDERLAEELGVLAAGLRLDGRIAADIEREVLGDTVSNIDAEQREAREVARKHGLDLSGARGSGKGGWVTTWDVRQYVEQLERSERERKAQEQRRRQQQLEEQKRKERERRVVERVDRVSEGLTLYNQERYQEALEAFDRALGIDPDHAFAHKSRGWALHNLGRHQQALEAYNRSLRTEPNDADTWDNKGRILRLLGRHQEAVQAYERARIIDPDHALDWFGRGYALQALGRYREALDAYERVLRTEPNDAATWNNKGNVLENLGRFREALEAYERALSINPDHALARSNKDAALRALVQVKGQEAEQVVAEARATLDRGWEEVGGRIKITNQRVIFEPHRFNFQTQTEEIPLTEIVEVGERETADFIANRMSIRSMLIRTRSGSEYRFAVWRPGKLIRLIKDLVASEGAAEARGPDVPPDGLPGDRPGIGGAGGPPDGAPPGLPD